MASENRDVLIVFAIVGLVALSAGAMTFYVQSQLSTSTSEVLAETQVKFGPMWRNAGNFTLYGAQSSCLELHLNCSAVSESQSREYLEGVTVANLETGSTQNVTYTIVLINDTSYCIYPSVQWIQRCPSEIGDSSQLYNYSSSLNLAFNCLSSSLDQGSLDLLILRIQNSPRFISLEGNRSDYNYAYWSCSSYGNSSSYGNNSELDLTFDHYDYTHPFQVCGTTTLYAKYEIDVAIDLTPTGYDLYHSVYSSTYYDATNTTISCTTTT